MFLAAFYVGTRDGLKGYLSRISGNKASYSRPGRRSYFFWRINHFRKLRKSISDQVDQISFHIFIETTPRSGLKLSKTLRSLQKISGQPFSHTVVESGQDLTQLVNQSDADLFLMLRAGMKIHRLALRKLATEINRTPSSQVITFDSDLSTFGIRRQPLFRPLFSPEMMYSQNYIDRAFAVRGTALQSQLQIVASDVFVWEMLLNLGVSGATFTNISSLLLSEDSRSVAVSFTPESAEMVKKVLSTNYSLDFFAENRESIARVFPSPTNWPSVSIVVPTRHSRVNIQRMISSLKLTDYENFDILIIDNGGETDDNKKWYNNLEVVCPLKVEWWTQTPFNYSAVNNHAARLTTGEVIVFLNDDTQIVDSLWLKELVGYLAIPDVATSGFQLRNHEGLIQHGGVMLGPGGFADNLFSGLEPHSSTKIGSTDWYRNSLAVTGACVAISRDDFEQVGGFDERFELCGSDVVLGLDQIVRGKRNVVSPIDAVRHFESLTRGTSVPVADFFASYWRYLPWLQNGDPYVSPNVSQLVARPRLSDDRDLKPVVFALELLGRPYRKIKQSGSVSKEAEDLLKVATLTQEDIDYVVSQNNKSAGNIEVKTINWFLPDIDTPFFGGFNTAFRIASKLVAEQGVVNRFIFTATPNEMFFKSAVTAAFANLENSEIAFIEGDAKSYTSIPKADIAISTLWLTAYIAIKSQSANRYFYLIQDFEPGFYPASSMYAFAEQSYQLGLFGICNTPTLLDIFQNEYSGTGISFIPAVDRNIYFPKQKIEKGPTRIFVYARDHFRNCSEIALGALEEIKNEYGEAVEIIVAGARFLKGQTQFIDLGLMDFREAATLFQKIDIGLTLQISKHPSYLPLELMACGVPMVAPRSKDFDWLFKAGHNSLRTNMTIDGVVSNLKLLIEDSKLRAKLSLGALETIDSRFSDWDTALGGIYEFMTSATREKTE